MAKPGLTPQHKHELVKRMQSTIEEMISKVTPLDVARLPTTSKRTLVALATLFAGVSLLRKLGCRPDAIRVWVDDLLEEA